MASTMEQSPYGSRRREEAELNLREWALRAQISRDNTKSRRFSGSYITSYREENARSFRSSITISSTASSPGYPLKEEIDPSTYSFTAALKALQARAVYNSWECLSPDGFALNSKWNEAEKYICNPLSGEVPMECLSAKTLSGISFRNSISSRITMSAPLVYSSSLHSRQFYATKPSSIATPQHNIVHFPIQEKKMESMTRDRGTQSTPPDLSSNSHSPSPASTPPIIERTLMRCELAEDGNSPNCNENIKAQEKVEEKETKGKDETTKGESEEKEERKKKEKKQMWRCSSRNRSSMQGGCLSWMRKRQREKLKPKKRNIFLLNYLEGC